MMMRQKTTRTRSAVRVAWILFFGLFQMGSGPLTGADSPPPVEWEKTFDGISGGSSVQQTFNAQGDADGYIVVGGTSLVRADVDGKMKWERALGGSGSSVQQTADLGFIIAGYVDDGQDYDFYLVKTDSEGNVNPDDKTTWERTFGGAEGDFATSVQQTADGGFIITGWTKSFGAAENDVYLVKTDSEGNVNPDDNTTWERTFGGPLSDLGWCVQQTFNAEGDADGYIVAGSRGTQGPGPSHVYLLKTDCDGIMVWEKTFGGMQREFGRSVQQTFNAEGDPDGYIVAGYTGSFGVNGDVYLVKTDSEGNVNPDDKTTWERNFGGVSDDRASSVRRTSDGGYIVAGTTYSFGAGGSDVYLIKIDSAGGECWMTTAGGAGGDLAFSAEQTRDGGYIVTGRTESDLYLVKFAGPVFRRGDSNDDGGVDLSDVIFTLSWLFLGGPEPGCLAVANTNGDEGVDLSDPVSLLSHLFLGGPVPSEPFLECGPSSLEADAAIGCDEAPASCTSSL